MKISYGIIFFLLGSVLASFYGVVATRLPEGKSIIKPGSHCNNCKHPLTWYDLIPILSFLWNRGKCRYCKNRLPVYEPVAEFLTGLSFMLSYSYYGIGYEFFVSLILISLVVLIFITDFKYMIILDSPLLISGILIFLLKGFYKGWDIAFQSLIHGLGLFLFMLFVGMIGKFMFKREALGGGDIKLSFIMGMILLFPHGMLALILSTFLALPYATFSLLTNSSKEVPYGPFLIFATLIVFIYFDKFQAIITIMTTLP